MSEGLLGGVIGGDPEQELESVRPGPEAFAAALAAGAAGQNPEVAAKTAAFFDKQIEVLEVQRKTLEAEHEFFETEWGPRLLGIRLRVGFQIFAVLVATLLGIGAAILIRDAVSSKQVVVEPFDAPPALAARGLTGKVIATGVLDELTRLQASTRSTAAARTLSGAWTNNIRLEVPETGISLGEISRLLRERFGHDVHVDGDLTETLTGALALTVRGNGVAPKTFSGPAPELEKLTVSAAEYVYAQSQPARWAAYLTDVDRNQEAIEFCSAAIAGAAADERPGLFNSWGLAVQNVGGSNREALLLHRAAVKLQPNFWVAHFNIQNDLMGLGDEEGAWRAGEQMRKAAGGRPGLASESDYGNWDYLTWNLPAWLNAYLADAEANGGGGTGLGSAGPIIAEIYTRLHDVDAAELALKTMKQDPNDSTSAAMVRVTRGRLATEAGDLSAAAAELSAYADAYASDPTVASSNPGYNCLAAPALEAAGEPRKADALLQKGGTFVDCYRFRADILDGRGNWTDAQKAYGAAVALAPDLPSPYYSWGMALARHGDPAGAEAKFRAANLRGPHWADPLKAWGDLLATQGKRREALRKYDEALRYAPNWKQLREARAAVAGPVR